MQSRPQSQKSAKVPYLSTTAKSSIDACHACATECGLCAQECIDAGSPDLAACARLCVDCQELSEKGLLEN